MPRRPGGRRGGGNPESGHAPTAPPREEVVDARRTRTGRNGAGRSGLGATNQGTLTPAQRGGERRGDNGRRGEAVAGGAISNPPVGRGRHRGGQGRARPGPSASPVNETNQNCSRCGITDAKCKLEVIRLKEQMLTMKIKYEEELSKVKSDGISLILGLKTWSHFQPVADS